MENLNLMGASKEKVSPPTVHADVFSRSFREIHPGNFSKELSSQGYAVIENAVPAAVIDQILSEVENYPLGFNLNDVAPVRYFSQTFFAHILAFSPTLTQLITDSHILNLCRAYLGPKFRLKCQRYYESGPGYQLGWHTDNKTVDNKKTDVKGIVFIVYLVDTFQGELQVVEGSNNWSGESLINDFKDEDLRRAHPEKIRSLPGKKGTIVVTDTYTVHRTRLLTDPNFVRKSLFFQVDDDLYHSEKIIVNTEFVKDPSQELLQYLGFGLPSGYKSMPVSGIHTLSRKDLYQLFVNSFKEWLKRILKLREARAKIQGAPKPNVINPN